MQAHNRRGLAVGGLLVLGLCSRPAQAQDGTTGFLIPYQGRLERDGAAVNATVELRVGLFGDAAPGTSACLEGATLSSCGVWADAFSVPVHAGAFTVLLGSNTPIPATALANPELYVSVAVRDGSTWKRLQGAQRLTSAPYAVRARASYDLDVDRNLTVDGQASVTGSVGVGTQAPATKLHVEGGELRVRASHDNTTPDLATFSANNQPPGVGIGYNRVAAIGGNANQDLRLVPRGTGGVIVDGPLLGQAIRNTGGTLSTYYVTQQRYVVRALQTTTSPVRSYTAIPQEVLESYCSDEDGCRMTLRMRNWNGDAGVVTSRSAVSFSLHFHYGDNVGGQSYWRREAVAGSPNPYVVLGVEGAVDGNAATDHVLRNHNCYFTDGLYTPPATQADTGRGMGLLNYNNDAYDCTCELIIDD
jgi:hypothetical protein